MKIQAGLFSHMVLQRNRRNVSEAEFSGPCAGTGPVTATVKSNGRTLTGFAGVRVGKAARGKMSGCLKGVPAGGPYDITLKAGEDSLAVCDVLVGDVWLLGGQSNMQGCGLFPKKRLPADPAVRAFFMDDRWAVAKDPIHNMWACVDPVHVDLCGARPAKPPADWGVCPGPAFGLAMTRYTGVPQGLIACGHGGTSMAQWDPGRKAEGGKSLYGALVRRLRKNGGRVAGMIWYQGCSDANAQAAPVYTKRMQELVAALRRDCRDRALPVAIVQIARVIGWPAESAAPWNSIQDQQRRLPLAIKNLTTVPAIDLPLDDGIHISGEGHTVLGGRLAQAMQVLRGDRKAGLPPIALKSSAIENKRGLGVAVVEYANVAGRLTSGGRPVGFTLVTQAGTSNHFDIQLEGTRVRVRSNLSPARLGEASLYYGYGTDPVCNIVDEAGRALPVMGPVSLGKPRAVTPLVRELRVSAYQPGAGKLDKLGYPASLKTLKMATRRFPSVFCDLHQEIAQHGGLDEVVWFACRFSCPEAMRLAILFGYDGPIKAWINGRKVFHDPKGTNPAIPDKGKAVMKAAKGEHEVLMALGTNKGAAWGIHLGFERLDVSKALVLKGPEHYVLPTLLG
jgi:sialate O-acetylesterase